MEKIKLKIPEVKIIRIFKMSNQNRCIICPKCSINKVFILLIQTVIFFRIITERFSIIIHFLDIMSNKSITGWKFKYDF